MKMSSNSRFLQMAEILKFNFFTDVMITLEKAVISEDDFRSFVKRIHAHGLLDLDDYSLVFLKFDIESCGSILQSKNLLCCKWWLIWWMIPSHNSEGMMIIHNNFIYINWCISKIRFFHSKMFEKSGDPQ